MTIMNPLPCEGIAVEAARAAVSEMIALLRCAEVALGEGRTLTGADLIAECAERSTGVSLRLRAALAPAAISCWDETGQPLRVPIAPGGEARIGEALVRGVAFGAITPGDVQQMTAPMPLVREAVYQGDVEYVEDWVATRLGWWSGS